MAADNKDVDFSDDVAKINLITTLPDLPGSYALLMSLPRATSIDVGRLGWVDFPAGKYVYLGSARGPGGLHARLGRHLRGYRRPHWHIDALRVHARVDLAWWVAEQSCAAEENCVAEAGPEPILRAECRWSQALAALPGAFIPAPGFGATDCRAGCPAHLVAFRPRIRSLAERVEEALNRYGGEEVTRVECRVSGV